MNGVPVRVHDQCLTSEVLGSLRCDCKQQLELALDYISEHGGCVIYMQQVWGQHTCTRRFPEAGLLDRDLAFFGLFPKNAQEITWNDHASCSVVPKLSLSPPVMDQKSLTDNFPHSFVV